MNRVTASGLKRAMACGASLHLPIVRDEPSPAAERGTWRGVFLKRVGQVGAEAALAEVPAEHRDACAALPLDELPETGLLAEVALAFNVATGEARVIGIDVDRQYGELAPMELAGAADVIGIDRATDRALVLDWKSAGYKERASDSLQLRFLALAAMRAYAVSAVRVEVVRLGDGGEVSRSWHDYDALDLDAFALELRDWFAKAGSDRTPSPGSHCTYCKSFSFCPAQTAIITKAERGEDVAHPFLQGGLSRNTVGAAYVLSEQLKTIAKELDRRIYGAMQELKEAETPRGTTLRMVVRDGNEKIDGMAAAALLAEMFGASAVTACAEVSVTKTALGAGLRKLHGKQGAANERAFLAALRERGGVTRKPSERLEEVGAPELKP